MRITVFLLPTILTAVLFSACNSKSTKTVVIKYAEEDTTTHVTFRATIITGEDSKSFEAETPYTLEFVDQSFVVTTYPQEDSVNLFMESYGDEARAGRVKGFAKGGTIFYIRPNGGPGYIGSPK